MLNLGKEVLVEVDGSDNQLRDVANPKNAMQVGPGSQARLAQ